MEQLLLAGGGVIRRREHPEQCRHLDHLRATGELVGILPGILVRAGTQEDWRTRLRAGLLWLGPDAVVTRFAAARLTFWPECTNDEIAFSRPQGTPRPQPGWPVMRTSIPPELQWRLENVAVSCPAYTAMELAAGPCGGDVIDRVLRSRQASLAQLHGALNALAGRPGNAVRTRLLRDSRDEPWSALERAGHRLLRQHRISGWRANAWVQTRTGGAFADLLFARQRVIVEFDGWEYHHDREAFDADRRRRNELVLAGYVVLNFTWRQVEDDPEWVISCIRRALNW